MGSLYWLLAAALQEMKGSGLQVALAASSFGSPFKDYGFVASFPSPLSRGFLYRFWIGNAGDEGFPQDDDESFHTGEMLFPYP